MFEGKKFSVVIIDTGVNKNHVYFCNKEICAISLHKEGNKTVVKSGENDSIGHGTAIFSIIQQKVPIEDILNINIFNGKSQIDEDVLISALEFVYENISANIINLSLGVQICKKKEKLHAICKKLTEKGVIIFSAFDGAGTLTYPASFPEVFGVLTGADCLKINDIEYFDGDDVVSLGAFGRTQKLPYKDNTEYHLCNGCSFACAHATTLAVLYLKNNSDYSIKSLKEYFKKIAIKSHCAQSKFATIDSLPFHIENAAIYPFNKEMHSLIRYSHLLNFNIEKVYDSKYKMLIGSQVNELVQGDNIPNLIVEDIRNIDWTAFDTLILGHTQELETYSKSIGFREQLVYLALKNNVRVYSFDPLFEFEKEQKNGKVFFPLIDESRLPPFRYEKLFKSSVPVLGIFGTTPKQGKFTLQLKLRELFIKNQYMIGQIGTEPSSLLFGMDYMYPIGYNCVSAVKIKDHKVIRYLNECVHHLEEKNVDIVIAGSQSGTITLDKGNLFFHQIYQYSFLLGVSPDAVILCINAYDDMDYIHRTIQFIEVAGDCKVIALVLYPIDQVGHWNNMGKDKIPITREKGIQYINEFQMEFQRPVYQLNFENDMQLLFNNIIEYYS